jgi:hypothetical protein
MISHGHGQRFGIGAAVLMGLLGLVACLPVPLGDPRTSKADSRFVGVWEWRDGQLRRAIIRQWDERTYVVNVIATDVTDDATVLKPRQRDVYKGWLTDIKGNTFLTLQPIETAGTINGDPRQRYFITVKVKIDANGLTATALNADFKPVKEAATAEALERAIVQNLEDPKLFGQSITATRWTLDQMKGLERLEDAFREWKP